MRSDAELLLGSAPSRWYDRHIAACTFIPLLQSANWENESAVTEIRVQPLTFGSNVNVIVQLRAQAEDV